MMVISLPKDILALNLCTEKKKSFNFLCRNGQECNTFFTMKIGNPFLPSYHIKTSLWIELRGICSDVLKSLTYSQSATVIYML